MIRLRATPPWTYDSPVAQLAARESHNLKVASSILAGGNSFCGIECFFSEPYLFFVMVRDCSVPLRRAGSTVIVYVPATDETRV